MIMECGGRCVGDGLDDHGLRRLMHGGGLDDHGARRLAAAGHATWAGRFTARHGAERFLTFAQELAGAP